MKSVLFAIIFGLFLGCSSKSGLNNKDLVIKPPVQEEKISDLEQLPQDVSFYTEMISDKKSLYKIQKEYEKNYFSVWNIKSAPSDSASEQWPFKTYVYGKYYGENLQLVDENFFSKMKINANFDKYDSVQKKALSLHHLNLRSFPTNKPLFLDPKDAGEGFPFDYLQNSSIAANKPLYVSHYSKDKQWVYVFSSFASGWVAIKDVVFMDEKYTTQWQESIQIKILQDDYNIIDSDGHFVYKSRVGMSFALVDEDDKSYTVLVVQNYKNNKPFFKTAKIDKDIATKEPLIFNKENLSKITNQFNKKKYGWGGVYGLRDCSSTFRDMFSVFGIWLPRNSYKQSLVGQVFNLEGMNSDEKIAFIKANAIPFETLLYKKGHIVLYVGTYKNEVVIFHNTWGIKTINKNNEEGRFIIGKTIFSTSELGKNLTNYDETGSILENLTSMNILTR